MGYKKLVTDRKISEILLTDPYLGFQKCDKMIRQYMLELKKDPVKNIVYIYRLQFHQIHRIEGCAGKKAAKILNLEF